MKEFIAAGVQIAPILGNIPQTIEKCLDWLEKAVRECDADLVVFPETITTGFTPGIPRHDLYAQVSTIPGALTHPIQKAAEKLGVHVIWPSYTRGEKKNEIYNSSILIDDSGEIIGAYHKTHPFPTERIEGGGWTTPGSDIRCFDTRLGKIGMMICYEGDFPEIARVLAIQGAEVIVRPSALLRSFDIWDLTNRARAYDNHVYVIGVNIVGPDAGDNYYFGHSMIADPIAHRLAQARGTEEIIFAKLNPDPLKYVTWGAKSPMIFDHLEDRNISLYGDILKKARSAFEPFKRIPYGKK
jgi:predicted amidohydrolase